MHLFSLGEMFAALIGGLGIFLLGMKNMSEGMQAISGERLRRMIASVTNHRLSACLTGTAVTCIVQSSSVTTVLVVGLVSSGFMTLLQACGVIMGANIGTTITGWILVLKIGKYGLPMLGVAALVYLFTRHEKVRFGAMAVMGIGMVFFGLELMSAAFKHIKEMPAFLNWFAAFRSESYFGMWKCVLAGCAVTAIVQSSSAMLGITIGLAEAGLIPYPTAVALVLGENIGTTVTALLASLGATRNAQRAAIFHSFFNIVGVLWITSIFPYYMKILQTVLGLDPGMAFTNGGETTFPHVRAGIALAHSGFNIANTIVFLPILPYVVRLITHVIPDKPVKEPPRLTFLDIRILDTPALGIQQSHDEIIRMTEHIEKMLAWLQQLLEKDKARDEALERKLFHREEILDVMQKEITEFLCQMLSGNISKDVVDEARRQLRIANEYESVGDYIAAVLKLHLKRIQADLPLSSAGQSEIMHLHAMVNDYAHMVNEAVIHHNPHVLTKAETQGDAITHYMKTCREKHLQRLETEQASPLTSLIFTDMLTSYRKIKDHLLNIAEALD